MRDTVMKERAVATICRLQLPLHLFRAFFSPFNMKSLCFVQLLKKWCRVMYVSVFLFLFIFFFPLLTLI